MEVVIQQDVRTLEVTMEHPILMQHTHAAGYLLYNVQLLAESEADAQPVDVFVEAALAHVLCDQHVSVLVIDANPHEQDDQGAPQRAQNFSFL